MGAVSGVDRTQRRFTVLGFPLAVIYKFFDDQGNYLAAAISYYAFIAIFPLLLLASSIFGFILQGNPELQDQVLNSALAQFPIVGQELGRPQGLRGSTGAVIGGALAAAYGSLGLGQAIQNLMATAWAIPRNSRPNPVLLRAKSLLLLLFAGIAVVGVSVISAVGSQTEVFGASTNTTIKIAIQVATVLVVGLALTVLMRFASARSHRITRAAPGAFTVALLWQLLQYIGAAYVNAVLDGPTSLNQTFGFVLGLIGLIYIAAVMAILGVEVNVVLARRLWPRALLTPFTDSVDLTEADRRAYAMYAQMQRHKGFETVVVRFDGRDGDTHEIVLEPDKKAPDLRGSVDAAVEPGPAPTSVVQQHPGEGRVS
ncbi:YihY/virulence factor BrkB family protein [Nocardioides sp.]|uniref:YihY/virulence factor BrkB family protein n=1 Tax=Nocardioides sp. TaxID=35761 RepID=UPI00271D3FCE|nr:YihY/virulence factor BrkB family protein [Nocardioides sp.]MDO9457162.1 YihY/virulence factor BrkB family protein [Nocardioides sp.]